MSSSTSGGGASAPGAAARSSLRHERRRQAPSARAGASLGAGVAHRGAAPSRTHAGPFDVGARPRYAAAQRHARAAGSNWKQPAPARRSAASSQAPSASVVCPRLSAPRRVNAVRRPPRARRLRRGGDRPSSASGRLASPRADARRCLRPAPSRADAALGEAERVLMRRGSRRIRRAPEPNRRIRPIRAAPAAAIEARPRGASATAALGARRRAQVRRQQASSRHVARRRAEPQLVGRDSCASTRRAEQLRGERPAEFIPAAVDLDRGTGTRRALCKAQRRPLGRARPGRGACR